MHNDTDEPTLEVARTLYERRPWLAGAIDFGLLLFNFIAWFFVLRVFEVL